MDWAGIIANETTEEEEMFSLTTRFVAHMSKRAVGSEGETTPRYDGKWSKQSSLDEEA